ncbi:carboxymuconolactone decarboxylase family protein [Methanobacterium sp. ACI-7]|uniref:carboxymuconolactone decarboxylase family protein n=1 Tax=unclassified Methanobacterium TaxID=2627676 RepID=UPI0039C0EB49
MHELPNNYKSITQRYKEYGNALDELGKAAKASGPLNEKECHLIQLAASAAIRSEGGVHSHARRAMMNGATEEEVYHAVLILTNTIGYPNIAAAISWVDDIVEGSECSTTPLSK